MAPRKDSERLNQALKTLDEVRGELSFEAAWLRDRLSPSKVAHRTLDQHTLLVLGTTLVGGLITGTVLFRKQPSAPALPAAPMTIPVTRAPKVKASLISTLFTAAVPLVLKFVTSKPVVTKLIDIAMIPRGRKAPRQAPVS